MGYMALISLDLPNSTNEQRKDFYEYLKGEDWLKIEELTTSWKVTFTDDVNRSTAINALKSDLTKAKQRSKLSTYRYAIQMGKGEVEISDG